MKFILRSFAYLSAQSRAPFTAIFILSKKPKLYRWRGKKGNIHPRTFHGSRFVEQRRLDSARCEKTRRRNPARDAFRTTWELGRCPFPPPPWKSNIRVARLALVSALEKLLSFATSEKPVAVVSFFASSALRRGGKGEERRIFFFSPRCQSHFVSRHASRTFTPPRIQCDRWNANKKHHTKVATALVDREARASRRVVAPFRQNFLSKFDDRPVCQYSTSTSLANRYANNFSLPFPREKYTDGEGKEEGKHLRQRALSFWEGKSALIVPLLTELLIFLRGEGITRAEVHENRSNEGRIVCHDHLSIPIFSGLEIMRRMRARHLEEPVYELQSLPLFLSLLFLFPQELIFSFLDCDKLIPIYSFI